MSFDGAKFKEKKSKQNNVDPSHYHDDDDDDPLSIRSLKTFDSSSKPCAMKEVENSPESDDMKHKVDLIPLMFH